MACRVVKAENQAELVNVLCKLVEKLANESIAERNKFTVGFSGGSLVDFLCSGLPNIVTEWSKWHVFFCDERIVKEDSSDSTFGVYKTKLMPHINIKEDQFVKIDHELTPAECAESYCNKMRKIFRDEELPTFDMLLLGMGPDGHTCSLFPGHSVLSENVKWVVGVEDSPKPPPQRVTLTFPVINNARHCVFALSGKGKAEMVKRILEDKEDLPAGRVRPKGGAMWLLDKDAASLLKV